VIITESRMCFQRKHNRDSRNHFTISSHRVWLNEKIRGLPLFFSYYQTFSSITFILETVLLFKWFILIWKSLRY